MAKKKQSIEFWQSEIGRAENVLAEVSNKYSWDKLSDVWNDGRQQVVLNYDTDTQHEETTTGVFVNWIWAYMRTFIPAVYYRQPKVFATAHSRAHEMNSRIVEKRTNQIIRQVKLRKSMLSIIRDALLFGVGYMKVGWFSRFGQLPAYSGKTRKKNDTSRSDIETFFEIDEPYAYRIHPNKILVDPEASSLDDARWVVQKQYKPFELVKDDPFFAKTDGATRYKLNQQTDQQDVNEELKNQKESSRLDWSLIYEIWDREKKQVLFYVDGCNDYSRALDFFPYEFRGFPFEKLSFVEATDNFYAPSPILPWLDLVNELSTIRTKRLDDIKKICNKKIYPPGAVGETQLMNLMDPTVEYAECDNPDALSDFAQPRTNPEMYQVQEEIKQDFRDISSYSELLGGSMPFSRMSATATATMEQHATIRFDASAELVADFIIDVSKKLFLIVRRKQGYPQKISVSRELNAPEVEYNEEHIEGDFFFSLQLHDMAAVSKQKKFKEAYDLLSIMSQFPETRRRPLLQDLLHAAGKTDFQAYLHPPQGPPQDPTWENRIMASGVPIRPNPKDDDEMHVTIHRQFMQSETYRKILSTENGQAIHQIFSQHTQEQLKQREEKQIRQEATRRSQRKEGGGNNKPSPTQSLQQGQAMAGSSPVGGQRQEPTENTGGKDIAAALGSILGG